MVQRLNIDCSNPDLDVTIDYTEGVLYMGRLATQGIYIEKRRRCLPIHHLIAQVLMEPMYMGHMLPAFCFLISGNTVMSNLPWADRP